MLSCHTQSTSYRMSYHSACEEIDHDHNDDDYFVISRFCDCDFIGMTREVAWR